MNDRLPPVVLDINGCPYNEELSPFYVIETPATPQGLFVLPANAVLKKGDSRWDHDTKAYRNAADTNAWQRNVTVKQALVSWPFVCCYFREISSDPGLYERMTQYATHCKVENNVEVIKQEITRLTSVKNFLTTIQPGSWVVRVGLTYEGARQGMIYLVKSCDDRGLVLQDIGPGYDINNFRRATAEEIAKHLEKLSTKAKSIVVRSTDGKDYTATFHVGYVMFGCAKIRNDTIDQIHELLLHQESLRANSDERTITEIKIGKGIFTPDIIAQMIPQLKRSA